MQIIQLDGYQTAIDHLRYLPKKQQMMVFDLIESFFEIIVEKENTSQQTINSQTWQAWLNDNQTFIKNLGFDIGADPSERQKSFLMWRANYEKALAENDDWTDKEYDDYLTSLKDKNDVGREVSFE